MVSKRFLIDFILTDMKYSMLQGIIFSDKLKLERIFFYQSFTKSSDKNKLIPLNLYWIFSIFGSPGLSVNFHIAAFSHKLLDQIEPNFVQILLGWFFKFSVIFVNLTWLFSIGSSYAFWFAIFFNLLIRICDGILT